MELDIDNFDALQRYLTGRGHVDVGETVSFKRLKGGVSSRTVKVTWSDGHAWILKQALPKLRVQLDWFSSPERNGVEAKALRWLNRFVPGSAPSFIFEDGGNHVVAMEAVPDEHEDWKSILLRGRIVPDQFQQFGVLLGTIHRQSSEAGPELSRAFGDTTYFESLRVEPYYVYSAQIAPAAAAFLNELGHDALRHKLSLVHGDFSPKNTLVYRGNLILLDYEVAHFGQPAFDVGFALTHFLSKAHHLPQKRARLAEAAMLFWNAYYKEIASLSWANALEPCVVRHALGCLLARVVGKSPLEYLTQREIERQRDTILLLIRRPPTSISHLIAEFNYRIEAHAED